MRIATAATSLLLAATISASVFIASGFAASDQGKPPAATTAPAVRNTVHPPSKPTWDKCFAMSVDRGFNHDSDEWHQSIVDCMNGKIPL